MLQFVKFAQENHTLVYRPGDEKIASEFEDYFKPVRQMDSDILWLKTKNIKIEINA